MIRYLCNLTVKSSSNMSMRCETLKMIEKSIRKMMHRMRRACIDAKNAKSSFSDLTKICQRIRSISMRKDQIFSVLFDRVSALQNRVCNDCIVRFLETILSERKHFDQYIFSKLYCLVDCFFFSNSCTYNTFL